MGSCETKLDRLVVGVSGSVAVLNLPSYLVALRAELAREVKVAMTPAATSLMPPSSVALMCDEVVVDNEQSGIGKPGHVDLARWADMLVVLPASADMLGQAANGLAPNLLATTILASPTPVVFFPNMNIAMWSKRAVQRNVETLRRDGHVVIDPDLVAAYEVASGEMREGCTVPEPERVVEVLRATHEHPGFLSDPKRSAKVGR